MLGLFLQSGVPWKKILLLLSGSNISVLAISAAQFWLSWRLKNFVLPVTIGLAVYGLGAILAFKENWDESFVDFFPYSYPILNLYSSSPESSMDTSMGTSMFGSLLWTLIILVMAFYDLKNKESRV